MLAFLRRLLAGLGFSTGPRVSGRPASGNGASSFHLWWQLPGGGRFDELSAVFEVITPPSVERRYFWALQASFYEGARRLGAGHLGLQWAPEHPGHGAVNWGGYRAGGGMLEGSASRLPSARNNINTRDYPWKPGRRYRLRIFPTPDGPGKWRGEVTDLETGMATFVRDLYGGGSSLGGPVVWSEVFADCDHPSVTVRWSDLRCVGEDGTVIPVGGVKVSYQGRARGGCDNTTVALDGDGVLQVTTTDRTISQGAMLRL